MIFSSIPSSGKANSLRGFIPEGKELTENWMELRERIKEGNFTDIYIGDYKTIQLTNGEIVIMEVAGIDTYYKSGDTETGHHVDFISRNVLSTPYAFNSTAAFNNGTAEESSPWRASELFQSLNDETNGIYAMLPEELKPCIIEKYGRIETRYKADTKLTASNGYKWASLGKLWVPSEIECFGCLLYADTTQSGRTGVNIQYPIFQGSVKNLVKTKRNSKARVAWWLCQVGNNSTAALISGSRGESSIVNTNVDYVCVPLCFRIG